MYISDVENYFSQCVLYASNDECTMHTENTTVYTFSENSYSNLSSRIRLIDMWTHMDTTIYSSMNIQVIWFNDNLVNYKICVILSFYLSTHKTENFLRTAGFTAYMVHTSLNFLCLQSEKFCVHTQYASLSTSMYMTIIVKDVY